MKNAYLITAGVSGALAVLAGAFGAHGLEAALSPEAMAVYRTAVLYHLVHSLALLGVAVLHFMHPHARTLAISAALFAFGIVLFSGSLYLYALIGQSWLGMIAPLGGTAFVIGWLMLATAGVKWGNEQNSA